MRTLAVVLALTATAAADAKLPAGFAEVPGGRSPDRKLTVIWPDVDHRAGAHNQVIEIATGKVLATLDDVVFAGESHADPMPRWSRDGSFLVWYVDGKWGSRNLVVVPLRGNQIDVRERVVQDVLRAVKAAKPRAAAIAKEQGKNNGSWYRDGLSIDVRPAWRGTATYPLVFEVDLTSDPKCLDHYPRAGRIAFQATARLEASGALTLGPLRAKPACD